MNVIPIRSNEVNIPISIDLGNVVYKDFYVVWRDFLNGTLTELNDDLIPENITEFADSTFRNYSSLTSVRLTNIVSIGSYCFYYCPLTELYLPNLRSAGNYAFSYNAYTQLELPELTEARNGLCYYCQNLETAVFDEPVVFYSQAFYNCRNLDALILRNENKSTLLSTNVFGGTKIASGEGRIYVPSNLLEEYKNDSMWGIYASQIEALN